MLSESGSDFRGNNNVKICLVVTSVLILVCGCIAQNTATDNEFRLNSKRPSAYITFERFGERAEEWDGKRDGVFLRFHNNTRWDLTLATLGCKSIDEECLVFYEVLRNDTTDPAKKCDVPFGRQRHKSTIKLIPSGKSVLFSVPKDHLLDSRYITIEFGYGWEKFGDTGGGTLEIIHRATFLSSDLPSSNLKN